MTLARLFLVPALSLLLLIESGLAAEKEVKVGVASVLSGDFAVLGQNISRTIETYKKRYLRHKITFVVEDAKKGSADGLRAYQKLINIDHVNMLIGGTSSNGTMAGKALINSSKTVMITPLTGGSNIDQAGPYVFRIGNSDIINGYQQAEIFSKQGIKKVALFTEETEYTQDISKFFKAKFAELGGELVYESTFLPDSTDFKSQIVLLKNKGAQAVFMSTQTGLAFGIFLKQLEELGGKKDLQIHTNFVAASNPDAAQAAGEAIKGVHYLAPVYDKENPKLKEFFSQFKDDHGSDPAIAFHSAGTVDALNMLQDYLDKNEYSPEGFKDYLLKSIKNYKGLMGSYSFDADGNSNIGFESAVIG